MQFDQPLAPLTAFPPAIDLVGPESINRTASTRDSEGWTHVGSGTLGDRAVVVASRFDPRAGYELAIVDGPRLRVAVDGAWARVLETGREQYDEDQRADDTLISECALGPALLLALALQGTFALHASGVIHTDRLVAFLGESGTGKSTLALLLSALGAGWRHAGDDVLPVTMDSGVPRALPHYPQLKLAPGAQSEILRGLPEAVPLAALYILREPSSGAVRPGEPETATGSLPVGEGTMALVGQTVAARLFAPDLARRHLAFCAALAAAVPVRSLEYPRRGDVADEVAAAIAADLASAPTDRAREPGADPPTG